MLIFIFAVDSFLQINSSTEAKHLKQIIREIFWQGKGGRPQPTQALSRVLLLEMFRPESSFPNEKRRPQRRGTVNPVSLLCNVLSLQIEATLQQRNDLCSSS